LSSSRSSGGRSVRRALLLVTSVLTVLSALAGLSASAAFAMPKVVTAPEVRIKNENAGQPAGKIGEELECKNGTWTGTPTFEYEWLRSGKPIERGSEEDTYYTLSSADSGYTISCVVYATQEGTEYEESSNPVLVEGKSHQTEPPTNTKLPEISGTYRAGSTLTCSDGSWTNEPITSYTFQWLRESEGNEVPIGKNSPLYEVQAEDAGHKLECRVTATNSVGPGVATSAQVAIEAEKLKNTGLPEVEPPGTVAVGHALTCSPGGWSVKATYGYQWLRNGSSISGANASTYTPVEEDEADGLSCKVTAKANGEEVQASSSNSVKVREQAPENKKLPEITGTPAVGQTLTCTTGKWYGREAADSFKYVWVLDRGQGSEKGVGSSNKLPVESAYKGQTLTCEVTAENEEGVKGLAVSEPVVVSNGGQAPSGGTPKIVALNGSGGAGSRLECDAEPSTWLHGPTAFSYQWERETSGVKSPITGAASEEYEVVTQDEGHDLYCEVTATNEAGSSKPPSVSAAFVVTSQTVEKITSPVISGNGVVNETLSCSTGTWSGDPTSFTYQWLRQGSEIQGATSSSHKVTEADEGYSLSCLVTASNGSRSGQATSASKQIPGVHPEWVEAPKVEGTAVAGATLTCNTGKWTGVPAPTYAVQWLSEGSPPPGSSTGLTYVVRTLDEGRSLSCEVTASNTSGSESVTSPVVHVPGTKPRVVSAPYITGSAIVGEKLNCEHGIWEAKPEPVFSYQWVRNDGAISGATGSSYTVQPGDQGTLIACDVIAYNGEGTGEEETKGVAIATHGPPVKIEPSVIKPTEAVVTKAEILAALKKQIPHAQSEAHIASVRKSGAYSFSFKAPGAGRLEIFWYEVPKGAHVSSTKPKPILIASCTVTYTSASRKTVKLKLTTAGRKLVAHQKHVKLTVKAVFTTPKGVSATYIGTFTLSR
jgi:hypothetical protein